MRALNVYLRLEFGSNGRWIFQIFCEVLHKIKGFSFYTHTWYYSYSYLWLNDSWNFFYHIQKNDTLNCISTAYIRKDCTVRQHRVVKVWIENAAWIIPCVSVSDFFLGLFFFYVCFHLLFSNLGGKRISNLLDLLLSAVEKRKDNKLLKKINFLVKEWFFIDNGPW